MAITINWGDTVPRTPKIKDLNTGDIFIKGGKLYMFRTIAKRNLRYNDPVFVAVALDLERGEFAKLPPDCEVEPVDIEITVVRK